MKLNSYSEKFKEVKIAEGIFFEDERGFLKKTMFGDELSNTMEAIKEVICSSSNKDVVRGLHFQKKPNEIEKFVTCIKGRIIDVFLDIRKGSDNYGQYGMVELSESDNKAIFIPKGFAHGYGVLSEVATVIYLQSGNYNEESDYSINPLSLEIDWKIKNPIISEKDKTADNFKDFTP